ncbi:MAG: signal peptide peptidase SppA [Phycisphaerales bacterium]|nr:signal peptide peptidase SppA [Phycisphaerales bacterium]
MERLLSRVWSAVGVVALTAGACLAADGLPARQDATPGNATALVRILDLEGSILEKPSPFGWLLGNEGEPTLRTIVSALHDAAEEDDLKVIVIRVKDAQLQTTQVEELGEAMIAARESGKKIAVFSEAYGPNELMLGSYADDVIIQSGGPVMLSGMHMEEYFLADALAWVGVKADMVQVGDYKGASEQMARNGPSPQWDQNISALLDGMYGNMRQKLMRGRKLNDSQLDTAMDKLWMGDADGAKGAGLVDSVIDLPELESHLEDALSAEIRWGSNIAEHHRKDLTAGGGPLSFLSMLSAKPPKAPSGPTIAVLHINGAIVDGDSSSGGFLGGGDSVGSRTIRNALEDILDENEVKGVVVRIDSPGGSATASEVIWQGLRRVAEKKPVWVSVGSMAASGGYYCAVGGDKIFVNPSSIVGSIGVVGGRMSLDGVYDKLKVNVTTRSRGPRANMFRSTGPWTAEELALVRGKMTQTYDLFTRRVSAGRKDIDLSKTAEGRLFTGNKAIELKMADAIGGINDAIEDLAVHLSLKQYHVMDYPGPKGIDELLDDTLGGFMAAPGVRHNAAAADLAGLARTIVGERVWRQIRGQLEGLMQMRDEPVLLIGPRALVFR